MGTDYLLIYLMWLSGYGARPSPSKPGISFCWHPLVALGNNTHILCFNGHFPGEFGLAGCPLISPPFIPKLQVIMVKLVDCIQTAEDLVKLLSRAR